MTKPSVSVTSPLSLTALSRNHEGESVVIAVPYSVWDEWRLRLHSKMTFENITDVADQPVFDVPLPDGRIATVVVSRLVLDNRPCVQVRIDKLASAAATAKA